MPCQLLKTAGRKLFKSIFGANQSRDEKNGTDILIPDFARLESRPYKVKIADEMFGTTGSSTTVQGLPWKYKNRSSLADK